MFHIALVVISACDVLEDRVTFPILIKGIGAPVTFLCVEPIVGPGSRHLGPSQSLLSVVEANLSRIKAWLRLMLSEKHAIALILSLSG